jgi:hypothetical protein
MHKQNQTKRSENCENTDNSVVYMFSISLLREKLYKICLFFVEVRLCDWHSCERSLINQETHVYTI